MKIPKFNDTPVLVRLWESKRVLNKYFLQVTMGNLGQFRKVSQN